MIQMQSMLKVADNTGAILARCIKITKKGSPCRYGFIGDFIVVSVRKIRRKNRTRAKVKIGEVHHAVIIKTKTKLKRKTGVSIAFMTNSIVLLTKNKKPIGTRVFGGTTKELRYSKLSRLSTLSAIVL